MVFTVTIQRPEQIKDYANMIPVTGIYAAKTCMHLVFNTGIKNTPGDINRHIPDTFVGNQESFFRCPDHPDQTGFDLMNMNALKMNALPASSDEPLCLTGMKRNTLHFNVLFKDSHPCRQAVFNILLLQL